MRTSILILTLLLAAGCEASQAALGDGTATDDTANQDTANQDTAATDDTGAGDDTADDTGEEGPQPDITVWDGTETFSVDFYGDNLDCEGDTVALEGGPAGDSTTAMLADACPACTAFYEVHRATDTACEWVSIDTDLYRGLVLGDTWVAVYSFTVEDGAVDTELLDSAGNFDGWTASYGYTFEKWGADIDVAGTLTFPEARR